jgi:glycosyltransferase involved in cell wall biosynthesis
MKIAQVVSTFSPRLGGMGAVCAQEALALVRGGHQVTVFTLQYDDADYAEHDKQFPFTIIRLKPLVQLGDAGLVPQIIKKINNNFDLVHLHYPFYGGAEWLSFVKIPLVITYHMDAQVRGIKLLIEKVYNLVWPKLLFTKANAIITVDAQYNQSKLLAGIAPDKIIEISNGVDVDVFNPQSADFKISGLAKYKEKKVALFVGNLLPVKRLDLLLKALQLLQDKEVVLVIVGDGERLETCKQMTVELGVEAQVEFVGACRDKNKLAQYYNIATCVIVPSDYESFSLVAIEAMACARPLILSDLPMFKNKFEQAVFFERGSAESLCNALHTVFSLSDDELKKMGDWGRAKAVQDFSFASHIKKIEDVYSKIRCLY